VSERVSELLDAPWAPIAGWQVSVAAAFALAACLFGLTGERWFPVLDSANLVFHEAGHPLVGALSHRLAVYGGTLLQLAIPAAVAVSFFRRREPLGFALAGVWLFQNFFNIARYLADARAQELPLVGGGDHDWTEILTRWNALHLDGTLGRLLAMAGALGAAGCVAWLALRWRRQGTEA
jgi:hypothetical protein